MDESPSDRDKDISDNDDRPPPGSGDAIQWDFICFGLRQRAVESRLLDVVSNKHRRKPRIISDRLVCLVATDAEKVIK